MGKEAREFLLKAKMIGRIMDFFFDNASPFQDTMRDMSDINPWIKEKPDIGLPTKMDKNQTSYY